jgi:hypothetical protein
MSFSSLARRTPVRPHPEHRVARPPRGQERAFDPDDAVPRFSLTYPRGSRNGGSPSARVQRQALDRAADALVQAMGRLGTAGADSCAGRNRLIDAATIHSRKFFLHAQFYQREAAAVATPSHGLGSGILPTETGGRIQAQNAGERSEFGSQTRTFLANGREWRGFLSTWKPRRFAGTVWWAMEGSN